MSSADDHPLKSSPPLESSSEDLPKTPNKDAAAIGTPVRPSIADSPATGRTLSTASITSSNPSGSTTLPAVTSGASTPTASTLAGSYFSPTGSKYDLRNSTSSPSSSENNDGAQTLIAQAFAPHVAVLSSSDCEELLRHKGINGGLLELLRPFGEMIPGRVVVRDSTGASKPLDDFGIRFMGIKDGLEAPRMGQSAASPVASRPNSLSAEYRPARIRSGGHVVQIEQLVERRLDQATEAETDGVYSSPETTDTFFNLYTRKLLSGLVLSPHETFAHPVALVIAISSRSTAPIEDLRTLYSNSNTGEYRLPPWVNNEFLRYYVLVHDEDFDDIKQSTALYEQMKRHFGLHCHLLRLRSTPCLPSDDGAVLLAQKMWTSAAEDLSDLSAYESGGEEETPSAMHIFESDATSIRSFVREMVTQSILPSMERAVATWNDQVASRRRGISGRFMSLSKRFTPFGGRSSSPSTSGSSNYDTVTASYRPDLPEAIMRKLADYAVMLRDYKLATSTYEILCGDYKNDKAWRYYAGANEMAALTYMMAGQGSLSARTRAETLDPWIENAYYSYFTRCNSAFYSLRTIILAAELLRSKEGGALDDAARWLARLMDDRNIGPVGHALLLEMTGSYFALKKGTGALRSGGRRRKAALWFTLATSAWLEMDKQKQAGRCLHRAVHLYDDDAHKDDALHFEGMQGFLHHLGQAVQSTGPNEKLEAFPNIDEHVEQIQQTSADQRAHRRSVSLAAVATPAFDPLGVAPMTTPRSSDRQEQDADGFE